MTNLPSNFPFNRTRQQTPAGLESRAGELRDSLAAIPAESLASRTGASYRETAPGQGEFHLSLLGIPVLGVFPNLTFYTPSRDKLPDFQQALLLYYFSTATGAPLTGQWVSFADLPGGRMYSQAFQGYSGDAVRDAVSNQLELFKNACLALGGQPLDLGSASFSFSALPRAPLLLTFWLGDEEFPSSCKVLFDGCATAYLPIDGCAILGSQLTGKIVKRINRGTAV